MFPDIKELLPNPDSSKQIYTNKVLIGRLLCKLKKVFYREISREYLYCEQGIMCGLVYELLLMIMLEF